MAARRLIILMLALLVASSVAAALVPVDPDRLRDSSTTSTAAPEPSGESVRRTIDAGRANPATVAIALGDQLALTVAADRPDLVEILGLGELEDVDPNSPATFDLRPFRAGVYPVRLVNSERTIARIEVTPGEPAGPGDGAAK